jgi:hypothetical protein
MKKGFQLSGGLSEVKERAKPNKTGGLPKLARQTSIGDVGNNWRTGTNACPTG